MAIKSNSSSLKYVSSNYFSYILFIQDLVRNKEDIKILDFGCGTAMLLQALSKSGINCKLYGVDIYSNQSNLEIAKENAPLAQIKSIKPYESFDFGEKFDIILSNQVFEHIENLDYIYQHLYKIMKPNGIMFCGFPTKEIIIEPHLKIPLIHRLEKESKALYFYLKISSFLKLGQFSRRGFDKRDYIENRLSYCKNNLFYHSFHDHVKFLNRHFSTVTDISDLWLKHVRDYKTYSNTIKFLIRLVPFKVLRLFLMRIIFGTYLMVSK
tara:strand:+ start:30 stop:830 length:801 start_codon:yes stop_codon:yes gene_type:complete